MEDIQAKQNFLREEIIDKGYSPENFSEFVSTLRDDGNFDLESWSMGDLIQIVNYYKNQSHKALEEKQNNENQQNNQENQSSNNQPNENEYPPAQPHQNETLAKENELTEIKTDTNVKPPVTSPSFQF